MLREIIQRLLNINIALVQTLVPIIEAEYGSESGQLLIGDLGIELRAALQELEALGFRPDVDQLIKRPGKIRPKAVARARA